MSLYVTILIATRYPIQTVPQPSAVFDLHFSPHQDQGHVCAAVSSTGTISFLRLVPGPQSSRLDHAAASNVAESLSVLSIPTLDEDVLFTYFSWHPTIPGFMAITTASGQVNLVQIDRDYQGLQVVKDSAITHSLEAWVVTFAPPSPVPKTGAQEGLFTILSGGDDSALRYASCAYNASGSDMADSPLTIAYPPVSVPGHNAGVTAILPLPIATSSGSHLVLTGSYDDTLRIYTITPLHTTYGMRKATLLAEKNLGGGVWRLNIIGEAESSTTPGNGKWRVTVLASCMHAGARVLQIRGDGDSVDGIDVLARFEEHKSMNYGSDWSRVEGRLTSESGEGKEVLCVSTSFYDRLLCVWKLTRVSGNEGHL